MTCRSERDFRGHTHTHTQTLPLNNTVTLKKCVEYHTLLARLFPLIACSLSSTFPSPEPAESKTESTAAKLSAFCSSSERGARTIYFQWRKAHDDGCAAMLDGCDNSGQGGGCTQTGCLVGCVNSGAARRLQPRPGAGAAQSVQSDGGCVYHGTAMGHHTHPGALFICTLRTHLHMSSAGSV